MKIAAIAYVALALSPLVGFAVHYAFTEGWRLVAGTSEPDWSRRDAVTAPERAADLAKRGLLEQLVSFSDGLTGLRKDPGTNEYTLYAIGVGQTTLPNERQSGVFNLVGGSDPAQRTDLRYASSSPVTGAFNNVLLFEPKTGEIVAVFASRVGISSFKYLAGPDYEVLVIFATDKDTDKDGRLSDGDLQSAYVYSIKDRRLHAANGFSGNPVDVIVVPGHDFTIIRATQDDNGDGHADSLAYYQGVPEPDLLFKLNLRTYEAAPLVSQQMLHTLQATLEARTKKP
jgi:hypothetical protein